MSIQVDVNGLHGIFGGKGSGKSMLAIQKMSGVIMETERIIVTNLSVKWDGWAETLQKHFGWDGDLVSRVWLIPHDDLNSMRCFWHVRGFGWELPYVSKEEWQKGKRLDFRFAYRWKATEGDVRNRLPISEMRVHEVEAAWAEGEMERELCKKLPKVSYFIDEGIAIWPAEDWQALHPETTYYLTQQRKNGDNVYILGIDGSMMLKKLRLMVDDSMLLDNMGKRVKGIFKLPMRSKWSKYRKFPESSLAKPMRSGSFFIDVEKWGNCYDTSAGVGEGMDGGMDADKNEKRPGIDWKWAIVGCALLGLLLTQVPGVFRWVSGKVFGSASAKSVPSLVSTNAPAKPEPLALASTARDMLGIEDKRMPGNRRQDQDQEDELELSGLHSFGGVLWIYFRDGSEGSSGSPEFQGAIRHGNKYVGVKWAGKRLLLKPAKPWRSPQQDSYQHASHNENKVN